MNRRHLVIPVIATLAIVATLPLLRTRALPPAPVSNRPPPSRRGTIESIFAEPGETSISSLMTGFFTKISGLAADPADRALRGGAIQGAQSLAEGLNLLSDRLGQIGKSALADVRIRVEEVNRHAEAIAALNIKIGEIEATGVQANDLRDQRDQHVREISRYLDTTAVERSGGNLDVMAGGYMIVSGTRPSLLAGGLRSPAARHRHADKHHHGSRSESHDGAS